MISQIIELTIKTPVPNRQTLCDLLSWMGHWELIGKSPTYVVTEMESTVERFWP